MKIRETMWYFFAGSMAIGLYCAGYWHGQSDTTVVTSLAHWLQGSRGPGTGEVVKLLHPDGSSVTTTAPAPGASPLASLSQSDDAKGDEFDKLLDNSAWFALERWLVAHKHEVTFSHGARLVQGFARKINKYDATAMRRVLRAYLDVMPDDIGVLFLLSDLQQISGMREAALGTLFNILSMATHPNMIAQARRQADQIIFVIDNELQLRGALAERTAFWQHNSQRLPSSDRYRYEWARSLAAQQLWDAARRVLMETGNSDIAQATLDELAVLIDNAEQGLQFQRDGERLLSAATTPEGVSLLLLVDTGANITSLSMPALRAVSALRLQESARIRTASGIVETGVFRIDELQVQGRRFNNIRVLQLPVELPGLDGLLGLDIINALSLDPLQAGSG